MADEKIHRNDIYGDLDKRDTESPLIPAATVVLLRQNEASGGKLEVLMLQKNTKISFGGMWVFPGGKIDAEDFPGQLSEIPKLSSVSPEDVNQAAINAVTRETEEETGLKLQKDSFVWFSHWTPPASTPKRFSTWFFISQIDSSETITIDGQEITNHRWITAEEALQHHSAGEIDLAPPTWICLYQISRFNDAGKGIEQLDKAEVKYYETRVVKSAAGTRVAMWHGDAGYDSSDADQDGARHRLVLAEGGFSFENTVADYDYQA